MTVAIQLDKDLALNQFINRYVEHHGKQIDDSKLPAGSPMHYYCHGCEVLVATKPENWFLNPPPKYCDPCEVLVTHGLLDEGKKLAQVKLKEEKK